MQIIFIKNDFLYKMKKLNVTPYTFVDMITESVMKYLMTEAVMSINDIYEKYYQDIPQDDFTKIIQSDPTWNPQKQDKMGKYAKWLLSLYRTQNLKIEDLYKATEYLTYFNKYINKIEVKDINKYKNLPELYSIVKEFIPQDDSQEEIATSKSDEVRRMKKDVKKIYEDSDWLILTPLTKEAAIYYGKGTQWCTAAEESYNYFNDYSSKGPLFINIDKRNNRKYQFHFETNQFMDEEDRRLSSPIAETIGMSDAIVRQVYTNHILTLLDDADIRGLNNNVYINSVKDVIVVTEDGNYNYMGYLKDYSNDSDIIQIAPYLFYTHQYGGHTYFINTKDHKVNDSQNWKWFEFYKRKDGNLIFHAHYKDGLVVARGNEENKIEILYNFHTTANEKTLGEDIWDEDEIPNALKRYMIFKTGDTDAYDSDMSPFNIFDLEALKMVLTDVVYDRTRNEDGIGTDNMGNGEYRNYLMLRDVVTWDSVVEKFYENYASEEDNFDNISNDIAYEEAVYYSNKYIIYEDTGEIQCLGSY